MNTQAAVLETPDVQTQASIRHRILHLLGIYPIVSPTMMQSGLGPQTRSIVWRPVLDQLIEEGIVKEDKVPHISPAGRHNLYSRIYKVGQPKRVDVVEGVVLGAAN